MRLSQKILAVTSATLLGLGAWGYFSYTQIHNEWFYSDILSSTSNDRLLVDVQSPTPIAHAGGSINGFRYTNSREALLASLKAGFRYIQIDLRKSLDGHYFGAHKIKEFNEITGHGIWFVLPPTVSQIRERKIHQTLTPLLLTDIAEILQQYPGVHLVTDKADDYESLLDAFPYPDRLIVEVSRLSHYIAAKRAGIRYVALNTDDFDLCRRHHVSIVVTSHHVAETPAAIEFIKEGNVIMATGYDDAEDIPEALKIPGFFAYLEAFPKRN